MTYSSRIFLISVGTGSLSVAFSDSTAWDSSEIISLQRSTRKESSAASDVYKRQGQERAKRILSVAVYNHYKRLQVSEQPNSCLLYTSPSPRDAHESRMPSSA